jgi:hypothetical protein
LPPPETPAGADAATASPRAEAPTAGAAEAEPIWTAPADPFDVLPPPTWADPIESDAVLLPPAPTVTGAVALALAPEAPPEADGLEFTAPTWTAPTEFVAVLSAGPTDVGADTEPTTPDWSTPADGVTSTLPTWTAPTEPVASFWASAGCAVPSVSAANAAITNHRLDLIDCLLLCRDGTPGDPPGTAFLAVCQPRQTGFARDHSFE